MYDSLKIALLGGGAMGEALITGILAKGVAKPASVAVSEPRQERRAELEKRHGVRTVADNAQAVSGAGLVLLAVKPQMAQAALEAVKGKIDSRAIVLSIMAGVPAKRVAELTGHARVVRAMPNTPAQIGRGVTGWFPAFPCSAEDAELVEAALSSLGAEIRFADEAALDKVTALSGSGPAYLFLFAEAMIDAGVRIGLSRDVATTLVQETISGSAEYWKASGAHVSVLRNQVTSPAGTTAAALHEMERGALRAVMEDAVEAAYEKSKELGRG